MTMYQYTDKIFELENEGQALSWTALIGKVVIVIDLVRPAVCGYFKHHLSAGNRKLQQDYRKGADKKRDGIERIGFTNVYTNIKPGLND